MSCHTTGVAPIFGDSEWQMSFGERAALEGILSVLKPSLAIELGTAQGGSLRRIAAHSGRVHTFDLQEYPLERRELDNVEFHVGDSHAMLPDTLTSLSAARTNVDFALVDGDHSVEGVRRDVLDLLESPAVRGTVILLHDTANEAVREGIDEVPFEAFPKVTYVELDLVCGYVFREESLRHELWGGLGVVLVDVERQAYFSTPARQQRYYESAVLLRESRDRLVSAEAVEQSR